MGGRASVKSLLRSDRDVFSLLYHTFFLGGGGFL